MKKRISLFLVFCVMISLVSILTTSAWTDGPAIANTSSSSEDYDYEADMAFDNYDDTIWHTQWREGEQQDVFPQSIIVEFDNTYWIDCVGYLPRQDGSPNGTALDCEIWVSTTGSVNDHGTDSGWTKVSSKSWEEDFWMDWRDGGTGEFQNIEFDAVEAKLVKFVLIDGIGGWSSAAEIEIGFLGVSYTPQSGFTPKSAPGTPAPAAAAPEPVVEAAPAPAPEVAPVVAAPAPAPAAPVAVPQTSDTMMILFVVISMASILVYKRVALSSK